MSKREIILIVIGFVMVLFVSIGFFLGRGSKPVETALVKRGNIEAVVKESGLVDSEFSEQIVSNIEGIISELKIKEGDQVRNGQLLCIVRNPTLREKIRQQEAELSLAQKELSATNNSSLKARYNLLKDNIADLKSAMEPSSHIDGTVIKVNIKNGEKIIPGKLLFVIADMKRPIVNIRLKEADIPNVKIGQLATITGDFLGNQILPGRVIKISSLVSRDIDTYVETWVNIYNPQKIPLKFGAFAEAKIITHKKESALIIPKGAVIINALNYVFTVDRGKAIKNTVEMGLIGEDYVEIISGLKEGDVVITAGNVELEEGERVRSQK